MILIYDKNIAQIVPIFSTWLYYMDLYCVDAAEYLDRGGGGGGEGGGGGPLWLVTLFFLLHWKCPITTNQDTKYRML